ncbi:MAG: hypothetical protein J6L81_05775 [Clostridia bacterium]|nr:hypothetical protein [Clostridia bacterium]
MKKLIFVILLLVLCVSAAGCEKEQSDSSLPVDSAVSASDLNEADDERKITLSGNPEDSFVAEEDCYTEGKDVVLYFQKGVTVKGDMLKITEKVMDDLSRFTGYGFENNCPFNGYKDFRSDYFCVGTFDSVNKDAEKINVVIINNPENSAVEQAFACGAVLDTRDYDFEESGYQLIYHELSHVIHLRNGANLSDMMCEGFAVYTSYMTMKQQKLPVWSHIQFFSTTLFDEKVISQGEKGFRCCFEVGNDDYHYGFRFVMFLEETYGKNIFFDIAKEAETQEYENSLSVEVYNSEKRLAASTEHLKSIIKAKTSDDVFDRFAKWNKKEWDKRYQEYKDYMNSIGQVIDW